MTRAKFSIQLCLGKSRSTETARLRKFKLSSTKSLPAASPTKPPPPPAFLISAASYSDPQTSCMLSNCGVLIHANVPGFNVRLPKSASHVHLVIEPGTMFVKVSKSKEDRQQTKLCCPAFSSFPHCFCDQPKNCHIRSTYL